MPEIRDQMSEIRKQKSTARASPEPTCILTSDLWSLTSERKGSAGDGPLPGRRVETVPTPDMRQGRASPRTLERR